MTPILLAVALVLFIIAGLAFLNVFAGANAPALVAFGLAAWVAASLANHV